MFLDRAEAIHLALADEKWMPASANDLGHLSISERFGAHEYAEGIGIGSSQTTETT